MSAPDKPTPWIKLPLDGMDFMIFAIFSPFLGLPLIIGLAVVCDAAVAIFAPAPCALEHLETPDEKR